MIVVILPGNYFKNGEKANSLFLFTSFFQHFKCYHHFPFNLKEKIKEHNDINTGSKSFEVLWKFWQVLNNRKTLIRFFSE